MSSAREIAEEIWRCAQWYRARVTRAWNHRSPLLSILEALSPPVVVEPATSARPECHVERRLTRRDRRMLGRHRRRAELARSRRSQ